jgi:hypothetical protein
MNKFLRETIVKHIFANFAIIPSSFVNLNNSKSLMDKDFILQDKIPFIDINNNLSKNKVWGCQISSEQQEVKILLGDCSQDNIKEYALIIQLKNAPIYGVYLICDDVDSEALIACSLNGKEWLECQTYLQATFLAGMEQIKDVGLAWTKCSNYKDQFEMLLSFIKFHDSVYEEKYERQEN